MITTKILSQLDSRWSWKYLGFSYATIGAYGCIISCLAMMAGYDDVSKVNDLMKATGNYANGYGGGAFLNNLVVWGNVPNAIKNLKYVERGWSYNNDVVKKHIKKGYPVIVQVDAAPIGAPRTDHYILFIGDQKCVDPWTGKIRPTSDFPDVKGYALYEVIGEVDPYIKKNEALKIAIDRLKTEFDVDLSHPNVNNKSVYEATMRKIKKISDTGTL